MDMWVEGCVGLVPVSLDRWEQMGEGGKQPEAQVAP